MSKSGVYILCVAGLLSAGLGEAIPAFAFLAAALCFAVVCVADAIKDALK